MNKYALIAPLSLIAAIAMPLQAAPNMHLAPNSVACKTLTTLKHAERMLINEPVLEVQRSEVNNSCTTTQELKEVTAFDIGVTAKVEFFALGQLDVYYVNTRDLISLIDDKLPME
ncbi:hypothetical protein [Vibrio phage H188]|nr:hypothetical protein [Vibrio phage H188]